MLSVALCTYNGEKFLEQQLRSILTQSNPVDELVICDDNSTDTTVDIILKFQNNYSNIIKVNTNHVSLGPVKNFEKAIGLCKGDIIFLSDQDDIWKQNKVERMIKTFNDTPSLEAIFSDAEMIDDQNKFLNNTLWKFLLFNHEKQEKWHSKALYELVNNQNKITGATLAIKKDLFKRAFPFPQLKDVWHDVWLGIHAAANKTLGWIDEPLIEYRIHANQQVGIGNGITLINKNNSQLKKILLDAKEHYINILFITDKIASIYPNVYISDIINDAEDNLKWLNFRLNLSSNILLRTFNIFKNIKIYNKKSKMTKRTIIRDILNPCT